MHIGLRIDVDTFRGTKYGVPNLCRVLAKHSIKASFFFCVGPDNMGRHLWRLLRPAFFWKMMRSKAAKLYGWDIIFRGTLWPGPIIGERLDDVIRQAGAEGHEIGLHAWDHHAWQAKIDSMDSETIYRELHKGVELLSRILGRAPTCSAVPGWKCNDKALIEKMKFPFEYNSDCRGGSTFYPNVKGSVLPQPQIPVSLPTYDEVIGQGGIVNANYNDYLLSLMKPDRLNVLAIHAEVEGISCLDLFEDFLQLAISKHAAFVPLGKLLPENAKSSLHTAQIVPKVLSGREGWVSCQAPSSEKQNT